MTPEEKAQLDRVEAKLNAFLNIYYRENSNDRFDLVRDLSTQNIILKEGANITLGTSIGTKIGTSTTQKIGFYNKTPVVQASAISAPSSAGATYSQSQVNSIVDAVNYIRTALQNIGITA